MRSVQLMRSSVVLEPLYSICVPFKEISLLNMDTTKFPFSRKFDWLSERAGKNSGDIENYKTLRITKIILN